MKDELGRKFDLGRFVGVRKYIYIVTYQMTVIKIKKQKAPKSVSPKENLSLKIIQKLESNST